MPIPHPMFTMWSVDNATADPALLPAAAIEVLTLALSVPILSLSYPNLILAQTFLN
jgi:hypothetical protein